MAFAPRRALSGVPSRSTSFWSTIRCSTASMPTSSGPISSSTAATAFSHALAVVAAGVAVTQLDRLVLTGGRAGGTAARASVPSSSATSTSTVGLPRESRISRAPTCSMTATTCSYPAFRGSSHNQPSRVDRSPGGGTLACRNESVIILNRGRKGSASRAPPGVVRYAARRAAGSPWSWPRTGRSRPAATRSTSSGSTSSTESNSRPLACPTVSTHHRALQVVAADRERAGRERGTSDREPAVVQPLRLPRHGAGHGLGQVVDFSCHGGIPVSRTELGGTGVRVEAASTSAATAMISAGRAVVDGQLGPAATGRPRTGSSTSPHDEAPARSPVCATSPTSGHRPVRAAAHQHPPGHRRQLLRLVDDHVPEGPGAVVRGALGGGQRSRSSLALGQLRRRRSCRRPSGSPVGRPRPRAGPGCPARPAAYGAVLRARRAAAAARALGRPRPSSSASLVEQRHVGRRPLGAAARGAAALALRRLQPAAARRRAASRTANRSVQQLLAGSGSATARSSAAGSPARRLAQLGADVGRRSLAVEARPSPSPVGQLPGQRVDDRRCEHRPRRVVRAPRPPGPAAGVGARSGGRAAARRRSTAISMPARGHPLAVPHRRCQHLGHGQPALDLGDLDRLGAGARQPRVQLADGGQQHAGLAERRQHLADVVQEGACSGRRPARRACPAAGGGCRAGRRRGAAPRRSCRCRARPARPARR